MAASSLPRAGLAIWEPLLVNKFVASVALIMGARAQVPVGGADVRTRRTGRAPGGVAVGEGTRVPVGRVDVSLRRWGWAP